jgi:hypothetical protein
VSASVSNIPLSLIEKPLAETPAAFHFASTPIVHQQSCDRLSFPYTGESAKAN